MQNYVNRLSGRPEKLNCNCLPDCSSITYDVEISQSPINVEEYLVAMNVTDDNSTRSAMSIFFKDTQFIATHRSELFGTTDFLANCGGLLGLFLGMSVLSLVELVYFFSLRLFCNLKMLDNQKHRLGVDNVNMSFDSMEMMARPHPEQRIAMLTLHNCQS